MKVLKGRGREGEEAEEPKSVLRSWGVAFYRVIGGRVDALLPRFEDLKTTLKKSGFKISLRAYVASILLLTIMAWAAAFGAAFALGLVARVPLGTALLLSTAVSLLAGAMAFAVAYSYPSLAASSRKTSMEENLPYVASHMAILATAGLPPDRVFRSLAQVSPKETASAEARTIVRDMELLGSGLLPALDAARERSPSPVYSDFLEGLIATTRSGADLKAYLLSSARGLMETKRIAARQVVETLGMLAEVYVSMLVVFPLILVIMFSVMGIIAGSLGGMSIVLLLVLVTYILIPLLALLVMLLVDAMVPKG